MNKFFQYGFGLMAFVAVQGGAVAADPSVTESRPVDARVQRVHLDGVVSLQLRQGATPSLTLNGERRYLDKTSVSQNGDTLTIETNFSEHGHINAKTIRAELVLPQLREVVSDTVGSTEVRGFSGDELVVGLEGAGSVKVNCNYKVVNANLGGVGSMNIAGGDGTGINLDLHGAGSVNLAGRGKWLKANLNGLGSIDAQQFEVDSVDVDLSGLGNATVHARQSASLSLSGLGSVTVYGKPLNRKVSVDGLGKVSWK